MIIINLLLLKIVMNDMIAICNGFFKIWKKIVLVKKYNIFYGFLFSNWCNSKSFLFCIKSYNALGHATIRTQWRGTESVHSDSFSYKAETNSPELPWTPPLQYSYDNIGNRKTNAGDREKIYKCLFNFIHLHEIVMN